MLNKNVVKKRSNKNKKQVKEDFVYLTDIVYPNLYVQSNKKPFDSIVTIDEYKDNKSYRKISESDLKITTKNKEYIHIGRNKKGKIKVGVNWDVLENENIESYINKLIYNIAYLIENEHNESFYDIYLSGLSEIFNKSKKRKIENKFNCKLDWDLLPHYFLEMVSLDYNKKEFLKNFEDKLDYDFELINYFNDNIYHKYEYDNRYKIDKLEFPEDYSLPGHQYIKDNYYNYNSNLGLNIWSNTKDKVKIDSNYRIKQGEDWVYTCRVLFYSPNSKGEYKIPAEKLNV